MLQRSNLRWSLLLPLLLFCGVILAASSPLTLMQNIANQSLFALQRNQSRLHSDPQIIHRIVNRVLVPHIDTDRMGGAVIGRRYWQSATTAQRKQFIEQFKYLVISTYSNALASYDDDKVRFYPIRGGYAGQRVVQINSVIMRKNGQHIAINYNLALNSGRWQIYDFSIEGVSMVQSYRSQFAGVLAQGGLPMLIKRLIAHNQR